MPRKQTTISCNLCGLSHDSSIGVCPHCGEPPIARDLANAFKALHRREKDFNRELTKQVQAAFADHFPILKDLEQFATRLPGWTQGADALALVMDFLQVEFGWTPTEITKQTPVQIINAVLNALRRKETKSQPSHGSELAKNANDKRDSFIYSQMKAGVSLKDLLAIVNNRKAWEPLESEQGISAAAKRYAERQDKLWPIHRKRHRNNS
jgi:hypothetical protein